MTPEVSTERIGPVALVRITRPKANALSLEVLAALEGAVRALSEEPPGAVVLTGGERVFSAGADIGELGAARAREIAAAFAGALGPLAALPRATIAAITGHALGGGLELALACDFRFAASGARLGQPEVLLGIIPGGGATQRLPRLVGVARAKELIFTGRQITAEEAHAIGLVDRVLPAEHVLSAALDYAATLASGAVAAHGQAKSAIDGGVGRPLDEGLALERERFVAVCATEDAEIGIRSFRENGPGVAAFTGR